MFLRYDSASTRRDNSTVILQDYRNVVLAISMAIITCMKKLLLHSTNTILTLMTIYSCIMKETYKLCSELTHIY